MHPPSRIILNNSHNSLAATVMEAWGRILYRDQQFKLATVDKIKINTRSLLFKNYWKNIYQKQGDFHLELEKIDAKVSVPAVKTCEDVLQFLRMRERTGEERRFDGAGPVVSLLCSRVAGTFTWTSRIYTVGLEIGDVEAKFANVVQSFKPKFALIFKGNPSMLGGPNNSGDNTGPWMNLILQFPSGPETQFVPPIFYLRLGSSDFFFYPALSSILRSFNSTDQGGTESVVPKCEDSGFRSFDATLKADPEKTHETRDLFPELLKSAIINVKCETFNAYTCEDFSLAFSSETVTETISKLSTMKPGTSILRVGLSRVQCFNTNGLVDEGSLQQFPVLFPPAVWISGKNTLPLSLDLEGFEVALLEEGTRLVPVSTRQVFL